MRRIDGDGVERFDSRVSVVKLERAAPVMRAIQEGAPDERVLALLRDGGGQAIGDILGGDFMWLADPSNAIAVQPPPPAGVYPWPNGFSVNPEPLPHGEPANRAVRWRPGIVEWYRAERAGRPSCSVHGGGEVMWCGVSDQLGVLRPEPLTARAMGGTPHIPTPAGWFVMMWCEVDEGRDGFYNFQIPA